MFSDQRICRGGHRRAHLHARAGLRIEYLGDAWLHAYRTAIEACKRYGVDVWIYDEQGWPSGFAGGKVNASGQDFLLKYLSLSRLSDKSKSDRLLAAYRKTEQGYQRTAQIENADLYIYFEVQEHYVDLLNPAVTQEFIRCTHEVYKKHFGQEFGKTIKGVFTDEPQIHVSSRRMERRTPRALSRALRGRRAGRPLPSFRGTRRSISDVSLPLLLARPRMFVQNYTVQIGEWCEQNGLILTGHFAGEEGLCVQVCVQYGRLCRLRVHASCRVSTIWEAAQSAAVIETGAERGGTTGKKSGSFRKRMPVRATA